MRSADLIREARLRAGLSQYELAERSGRDRSVIARWEQGAVAPSIETLIELVRACGFDLPVELVPYDPSHGEQLATSALLSPERRASRFLQARAKGSRSAGSAPAVHFDPYAIVAALERERVSYVLIGGFARVVQGTEELTHGLDLVPSTRKGNLGRLAVALDDLEARGPSGRGVALERDLARGPVLELETTAGELRIVPEPTGTRGYDDLRRHATREPIGRGLRPSVASIGDLARMAAALGREQERQPLQQLRTLAELERSLHRGIEL